MEPIKIRTSTTYFEVSLQHCSPFMGDAVSKFAFTRLTSFEFNPKHKKFDAKDTFYEYDYPKRLYTFPIGFLETFEDYLEEKNIDYKTSEVPAYTPRKIEVKMADSFKLKDEQKPLFEFISARFYTRRCLELQAGKGKTATSITAAVAMGKVTMVVVNGLCEQWISEIKQFTNSTNIYYIKGFDSIEELLDSDKYPEFIVCSLSTLRSYIQHKGDYAKLPTYAEFLAKYGVGTKIVDEAHLNFHANTKIDLAGNVPTNIYLSATFSVAKSTMKIFETIYPNEIRLGGETYEKYIHIFFYGYTSGIRDKCVLSKGYSHSRFEGIMLQKKHYFDHWMSTVMEPIINVHYINSEARSAGKLLILTNTTDFATEVFKRIRAEYRNKKCCTFFGGDDKAKLKNHDIIVSTPKSCGTGVDISNLRCCVNTESFKILSATRQRPGRLRKIPGVELHYVDMVDVSNPSQFRHWNDRSAEYKQIALKYREILVR